MNISLFGSKLIGAAAMVTAASTLSYASWKIGDYSKFRPVILMEYIDYQEKQQQFIENLQEQQTQTLESIKQLRFQTLMLKKQYGELTFMGQQELCNVAKSLEFNNGVPGCQ